MIQNLYLIKRGPKSQCHKAPYHPIIICTRLPVAKWEADWSGDLAWVWEKEADESSGWLLTRWNGLDIDYGHVVRVFFLPDGTAAGIFHDRDLEPWSLMDGATWWSDHNMPSWVAEKGVKYPPDQFTIDRIVEASQSIRGFEKERMFIKSIEKNVNRPDNWIRKASLAMREERVTP